MKAIYSTFTLPKSDWLDLVLGVALFKAVLRVALGSVNTAESGCRCISNYICWVNRHNDWKYSCIYRLLERRFLKFYKVAKLQSDLVQINKDSSAKMANFVDICLVRASLSLHRTIQTSLRLCDFVPTLYFKLGKSQTM